MNSTAAALSEGGVRPGGYCEVYPERRCVWTQAWERSRKMKVY